VKRLAGRLGGVREIGEFLGDQGWNMVSGVRVSLAFGGCLGLVSCCACLSCFGCK
jgi:hypothetical protein